MRPVLYFKRGQEEGFGAGVTIHGAAEKGNPYKEGLVPLTDHCAIIDADNQDPAERKPTGSLKDFPMILPLQEDLSVVRGRVIWIMNRLVEKPKI